MSIPAGCAVPALLVFFFFLCVVVLLCLSKLEVIMLLSSWGKRALLAFVVHVGLSVVASVVVFVSLM